MLCFCCLRWQNNHVAWDEITETGNESENTKACNTTNISIIWPQCISVLLFRHFFVVFTPQFLQLRSGRVERCETEKRPPLLTSDLISSLGWPHCLIRILHDWSALIRSSAWRVWQAAKRLIHVPPCGNGETAERSEQEVTETLLRN